jgi:hypothetical protein
MTPDLMNAHALLLALPFLVACSDTIERTYKTRTEAEFDGAIAAGWVPSWFPQEAMEIREAHDIATKSVMVRFSYPKEYALKVPQFCARTSATAAPPPPFKRAWWPASVPERGAVAERYAYHHCGETYVATIQSEGEGFVWSAK